jgi:NitT/TauT family transport system substrate-binding protein
MEIIRALIAFILMTSVAAADIITVGTAKGIGTASTMIAVEKGYYKELGLDVRVEEVKSSADIMVLVANGTLKIVEGGISAGYFNAIARNMPVKIISDRVSTPVESKILIRADLRDEIKSVSDLKGRRVGNNGAGSIGTYEIGKVLEAHGLSYSDVDTKILGFPEITIAFINKSIDAALVIQPWASQMVADGLAVKIANVDDYVKSFTKSVIIMNTDWAAKNPMAAGKYFLATQRAVREYCQAYHMSSNRQEVADILIKTGMESRRDVIDKYPWPSRNINGIVDEQSIMDIQDFYVRNGIVSRRLQYQQLVTESYMRYSNINLGPFILENKDSKLAGCR